MSKYSAKAHVAMPHVLNDYLRNANVILSGIGPSKIRHDVMTISLKSTHDIEVMSS